MAKINSNTLIGKVVSTPYGNAKVIGYEATNDTYFVRFGCGGYNWVDTKDLTVIKE